MCATSLEETKEQNFTASILAPAKKGRCSYQTQTDSFK